MLVCFLSMITRMVVTVIILEPVTPTLRSMYDRATQGNLPNNVKFSNCSSEKIAYFIDAVVNERNGKINCFTGKCISFDICLNCIENYGIIFIIGSQCLWVAILAISG